jgi:rubrerythrin
MVTLKDAKLFICNNCGYKGIRWNENITCKICGKEGRLVKQLKKEDEK